MAVAEPEADPEVTELLRQGWSLEARPMETRRRVAETLVSVGFAAAALTIALLGDATTAWHPVQAALLVAAVALAVNVDIDVGVGYTSPLQLAFVPMLLLLPTPWVPLLVAAGWGLGKLPAVLARRAHPDRLLLVPANCWFAVGPVLVLVAADAQTPRWEDWPVYLLALATQFTGDLGAATLREFLGRGIAPRLQLNTIALIPAIDALLSPLGLLAAFASQSFAFAFLLLLPLAVLLSFYASERAGRLASALALADAARERQGLIAGASHELVTPLAVLVGLTGRLTSGRPLDDARREQLHAVLGREVLALRHLVRQFVDYTRLKTDRDLGLLREPSDLGPMVEDVAAALSATGSVTTDLPPGLPQVLVDPDRLHQMIMSLTGDVLRDVGGRPTARLAATPAGDDAVALTVTGAAPLRKDAFAEGGDSIGAGLGLFVARELARLQGGEIHAEATPEGGSRYTLVLPRAGGATI